MHPVPVLVYWVYWTLTSLRLSPTLEGIKKLYVVECVLKPCSLMAALAAPWTLPWEGTCMLPCTFNHLNEWLSSLQHGADQARTLHTAISLQTATYRMGKTTPSAYSYPPPAAPVPLIKHRSSGAQVRSSSIWARRTSNTILRYCSTAEDALYTQSG